MSRQKIVFYFTPDTQVADREIGKSIFPTSDDKSKGLYKFEFDKSFAQSLIKTATSNSIKSSQESTATINLASIFLNQETDNLFYVDDYWEIWDEANDWCHFRGMVRSKNRTKTGRERTLSLELANAGWWVLGDRSIYYINPILTGSVGVNRSELFTGIKSKYGLLGKDTELKEIFTKDTTPKKYLDFLIGAICNPRINAIREDNFDNSEAIKNVIPEADASFNDKSIVVSRRKSQVEGSIWDALKLWEGYPWCQMFLEEGKSQTRVKWRYSRWKDNTGSICMGELAEDVDPIRIFADKKHNNSEDEYTGLIKKIENETATGIINAFFVTPWDGATVESSIIQQMSVTGDSDSKVILDEDSIIRNGYIPQEIKLPFIPTTISGPTSKELDGLSPQGIKDIVAKRFTTVGEEMLFYAKILKKMYTQYKTAKSGTLIMENNIPIQISRDLELYEKEIGSNGDEQVTHTSLNKITQYFDPSSPTTVLEYSRGFKGVKRLPDSTQFSAGVFA